MSAAVVPTVEDVLLSRVVQVWQGGWAAPFSHNGTDHVPVGTIILLVLTIIFIVIFGFVAVGVMAARAVGRRQQRARGGAQAAAARRR